MLISFSVQNFRSIKDKVTLSFEADRSLDLEDSYIIKPRGTKLRLLKLGMIYGANASGKTTILEALDFLRKLVLDPLEKKSETIDVPAFLFDDQTQNAPTVFSIEFFKAGVKYHYAVELDAQAILAESLYFYQPNKAKVFSRTTDIEKQWSQIQFGKKIGIGKKDVGFLTANTLWNMTTLSGYEKTNFESAQLQNVVGWFRDNLKGIIRPRTNLTGFITNLLENETIAKDDIVALLRKADFQISDIFIDTHTVDVDEKLAAQLKVFRIPDEEIEKIKDNGELKFRELLFSHNINGKDYKLDYQEESAGTQRYFAYSGLLSLLTKGNVIFPIDELESSLHPDLFKHFILSFLANAKNAQLIATTHYREFLMDRDLYRDDAIWFTEKQADGSTDLFSLADFDSSVIRDTSSVFNAYKIGKLGAVPAPRDFYMVAED